MLRAVWYKTSFSLTLFWRICLIRAWKHFLSRAVLLRAYSLSNSVTTRCPTYSFFMYRCIDTYCSVSVRLSSTSLSLSRYSFLSSLCLLRAWLLSLIRCAPVGTYNCTIIRNWYPQCLGIVTQLRSLRYSEVIEFFKVTDYSYSRSVSGDYILIID